MSLPDGLAALEDPRLSPASLTERVWSFGPAGGAPLARHARLLPDGRIASAPLRAERSWVLDDGRLVLKGEADERLLEFDRVMADPQGRLVLAGAYPARGGDHLLREVDRIRPPARSQSPPELIGGGSRARRPNLVILRGGPGSAHHYWPRDMADEDRSWDLCVSFYGQAHEMEAGAGFAEFRVLQQQHSKFIALHELLHAESPLWDYEAIALPDDDLVFSWRGWNTLFAIGRDHRLDLWQPALAHEGYITHPITGRDPRWRLRYTSFVEVMTPIFTREALRACVQTFEGSQRGFGLDNVWPKLLGEPRDRLAVVDAVQVVHTRPQGGAYDIDEAIAQGNALQDAYDSPSDVLEFGGVLAEPVNRQHAW